ncbi:MAG: hypothetical protein C0624_08110 [Desulfuromonas sp.]|nr:MAG: hypothetical protein C0624_08110 [Desulfuromonas sp.]
MQKTSFFIIGLGNVGLPLARMLSSDFQLVCIDNQPEALAQASQLRNGTRIISGDATSRLLLEEAGIAEADTVVISTTTEKINLEIARVIRTHFDVPRVLAIGITQRGIEELEALDVEVESIFAVSANGLRNRLEHRTKTVQGIGVGKNEILEVEIHPQARLANKPLATLRPKNWHIGIIYRDGNIIVPRGTTVLKPRDRVVILGQPQVLSTIAERLSFRFRDFPLEYGDTTYIYLSGDAPPEFLAEIDHLLQRLPLRQAVVVRPPGSDVQAEQLDKILASHQVEGLQETVTADLPERAMQSAVAEHGHDPGMIIFPRSTLLRGLWGKHRHQRRIKQLLRQVNCPLMLCSGTFPYQRLAVPATELKDFPLALEKALEIASDIDCSLDALLVRPSAYISGEAESNDYRDLKKITSDLAHAYRTSVRSRELTGNPIRSILAELPNYNLLITRTSAELQVGMLRSFMHPEVSWHVLWDTPISALLIPPREATL